MTSKIVVTGGAGFIGSHLVDALVDRGDDVHVVDNYAGGRREDRVNAKATYHEVDVREFEKLAPIVAGAAYVFHEAALPRVQFSIENPELTFSVNVLGTVSVLRAAKEGGVKRLVYAASSSAYGDQETLPLSEDLPAQPKSPYGLQKYVNELSCKLWSEVYGLSTVSLRYFNVYGPRYDPDGAYALVIGKFLKQRAEGKPLTITGDGTQTRDFTHIRDIVRANLLAAESSSVGKGETMNIGAGRNVSVNEIAALIGGPSVHIEPRLEPHDTLADTTKARTLLGWAPTIKIEEGIAELKKGDGHRMIIDGKAIAEDIYSNLAPQFAALPGRAGGRVAKLGIVVVGAHPVIESFVRIKSRSAEKLGVEMVRINVSDKSDAGKILQAVDRLLTNADAVIVQLPLPGGIDVNEILAAVPNEKDVDALNPKIPEEKRLVHAPVALAVVEILNRSRVTIAGAKTVVVGAGRLVGAPSAWLLKSLGAEVSLFTLEEGSIEDLKDADIVVLGTGNPGFVKPEHLKKGVALIDAGTSELNKKITGDADPACAEVASVFTPVPGGVGPVAVAMIFRNLLALLEKAESKSA